MERRLIYKSIFILGVIAVAIYFTFPLNKRINLGLDLKGGMHLVLKVDTTKFRPEEKRDAVERGLEVIRNRIDEFGVSEPSIQMQGEDEIVVQLPGISERQRALDIIGKTALLEFKLVSLDLEKLKQAEEGNVPIGFELKRTQEGELLLLEKEAVLTGESLRSAMWRSDASQFNEPVVALEFNPEGAKKFAQITANNVGRRLAIVLDGKVQSAPVIKEPIPSGEAVITGRFSMEEAQDLALILRVGALPAPMYIEEERTVGPSLGQDSINRGIKASVIGGALVILFMAVYYLIAGIIADIALILNLLIILGLLGMLPVLFGTSATLTLPGIAGIILSLGMAVDANVLINERIREELMSGRPLRTAVANGYRQAFSAIFDSNLTTLIAAFLLFQFGTGPIRGFAVTLTIGIIASLFTAVVVTRTILEILINIGWVRSLPMLKLIKQTKFDFIAKRRIFYTLSLLVIITGLLAFFSKGRDAYGIDFAGGQIQEYRFRSLVPLDTIRDSLRELGLGDATIQQFKEDPRVVLIKTRGEKNSDIITNKLKEKFPDEDLEVLRIEKVGPIAGRHLKTKANYALIWSLIGILIYVAFRFKHFNFAVAGVVALFHDVLVTLGFLAFTNRQIDLLSVTAFLTIAGYSINDTIVIYDRVRENSRLLRKTNLYELINLSVNQTLSRTLLTTLVTLLVVIAIFFFGGEVLSNFAFTLLVGFISGVYSTIYIASPLVLILSRKNIK
ncbi:MAG: protein translocase subunit SecD [Candidatus Omnitrophica bacterium]|nr:protein translocase subunit SecD [Candidatus Omnitrophota bacterium]